jgi:pilus assembly protein CpaC
MRAYARKTPRTRRLIGALIILVAVVGRSTLYAQVATPSPAANVAGDPASDPAPVEPGVSAVRLLVGRSTIVNVGRPIARVSLTSADIADALVTAPTELLINGKAPGTISMFVWDRAGGIRRYEIAVQRDLQRLSAQLKELFPEESIEVRANGRAAVLSGTVSSADVMTKMASLARSFVDEDAELVSLLQVGPAGRSNQVLLRVRFAEVSRSALTELGLGLFTSPIGVRNTIGRVTTQQFPSPGFDELTHTKDSYEFGDDVVSSSGKFTFSDFLNLFLYNQKYDLGLTLRALQSRGLFQSLAEPNMVAESGKEASFLAGGEFPIPVAQSSAGGTSITVQFKEFGIRLNFTPTVNGDRVHLKVAPEVSALDFSNAVTLQGFRIPALSTRRMETEVELNSGQTFAIAGLLNNTMNQTLQKVPGIGDIPILGLLFRSKAAQKNQTELVVMITPEILQNDSPGVSPTLPNQQEPYLPPLPPQEAVPPPPPAFSPSSAVPAPSQDPLAATPPAGPQAKSGSSPAGAAAAMTAMSPARRTIVHTPDPASAQLSTPVVGDTAPAATPAAAPARPLTAEERRAADQARKEEERRLALEERARAEEAERLEKEAEESRRRQKEEEERQEKLAREQAKRDAEAARRAAEAAKRQAEIDAEEARQQAELEREQREAVAEAEKRFKAAQAAYEAELAKQQRP